MISPRPDVARPADPMTPRGTSEAEIVLPALRVVVDEFAICPHCRESFRFVQVQGTGGSSGPPAQVLPPVNADPSGSLP